LIATGLYLLDGLALVLMGRVVAGFSPVRIILLIDFFRAFSAIDELRRADATSSNPPGSQRAA
jgi:hypothetical protein